MYLYKTGIPADAFFLLFLFPLLVVVQILSRRAMESSSDPGCDRPGTNKCSAVETCSNPGCDQPGTNKCSGCKTTPYCGPACQKAHWNLHKESCDGRLRKMGMAHLDKARGFDRENNWSQMVRYSDLAATKLKQMKDRPIEDLSEALNCKCNALGFLGQHREELECAKEWYCLWNTKPTDPGAVRAAFTLIQSCITNNKYADARLYASTLWEIINHKYDNKIPEDERQPYIAKGAYYLASATLHLAQNVGIPPEEKQKAGQEAIALARRALELHIQLLGTSHAVVANAMSVLAEVLDYFNDDDDEEVLRLYEQSKAIHARAFGSSSVNVATNDGKLGNAYYKRAGKALAAHDRELALANMELALPRYREEARIYRAIGRVELADRAAQFEETVIKQIRQVAARIAAAATRG